MNPIFRLLQSSIFNGWVTVIGAIAMITFGVSGLIIGQLDVDAAIALITGGITALGLGSKGDKMIKAINDGRALLPK